MYDYSMEEKEQKLYILKHKKVKVGNEDKIKVYYADGSVDIIDDLDDNLDIIEVKKDEQIKDALLFAPRIKKKIKKTIAGCMTISTGACVAGTIMAANLPIDNEAKAITIAGIGVLYLGSIVYSYVKNAPKRELEKLKYLDDNIDNLEEYSLYSNSLNGLNNKVKHKIRSRENPYSSLYVEDYDMKTLETINNNINRAKHFEYIEKKKR